MIACGFVQIKLNIVEMPGLILETPLDVVRLSFFIHCHDSFAVVESSLVQHVHLDWNVVAAARRHAICRSHLFRSFSFLNSNGHEPFVSIV